MNVLIPFESSGIVREEFRKRGHNAWSCDLLSTEISGQHMQGDFYKFVLKELIWQKSDDWDLLIAFPPCTHLAVSGARWFKDKQQEQLQAVKNFMFLADINSIDKIAIENPIGIMSTKWRKPDQIIQPWQFGHGETKATCLWLKGLPLLKPTNIVEGREARIHKMPPSEDRGRLRSITYLGIAKAMAEQWG